MTGEKKNEKDKELEKQIGNMTVEETEEFLKTLLG